MTKDQQDNLETLKEKLCEASVLRFPDFKKQFTLITDASNEGLGAILSQEAHPCCYISRTLNPPEKNYSTTEKELLTIVWVIKRLRQYLLGKKFIIRTDHQALKWLQNCKDPSSRLMKWRLKLEEYEYEIEYTKGKDNIVADALSRIDAITDIKETQRTNSADHERLFNEWEKSSDEIKVMKLVPNKKSFYQLTKTELGSFDKKDYRSFIK